jgi:anti-sigma regulatory factor (Ser/Thr protein kinase)
MTKLNHRAMVYDHDDDFLGAAVPFVREGLEAEETVLVIRSSGGITGLRDTLGDAAKTVEFHDSASWYTQPTRTVAAYTRFIMDNPGARIRVVAEPGWECGSSAEISEWTRYESLVNQAFAPIDASVLCMYDRRTAAPGVIEGVMRTHPEIVDGSGPWPNGAYRDPETVFAEVDRDPLPPPPHGAASAPVTSADLSELRWFIGGHGRGHGLPPSRLNDLLVAATEVATNAVHHGALPITCRVWGEGDDLVVEVTDAGIWEPATAPGFLPADLTAPGFGLWGVRMLCPLVQLRTGDAGTTVRLRVSRP